MFLDETSLDTKMARRYGRAYRGHRLVTHTPFGHWKTLTFLAGLRVSGLTAPLVVDGPMNGELFLAYVKQQLTKTLKPGVCVRPTALSCCLAVGRSSPQFIDHPTAVGVVL